MLSECSLNALWMLTKFCVSDLERRRLRALDKLEPDEWTDKRTMERTKIVTTPWDPVGAKNTQTVDIVLSGRFYIYLIQQFIMGWEIGLHLDDRTTPESRLNLNSFKMLYCSSLLCALSQHRHKRNSDFGVKPSNPGFQASWMSWNPTNSHD